MSGMRRFAVVLLVAGCWTSSPKPAPEPEVTHAPPQKISVAPVERWDLSTPRQALYSFVRAVEQERFDIVLKLVPAVYREKMTEDKVRAQFADQTVRGIVDKLRKELDNPITEQGDEARMPFADRFEVKLVREDGEWRIKDLD